MGWRLIPFLLLRKDFKGVFRGWRGKCPLQCVRVLVPIVRLRDACTARQRIGHDAEEQHEGGEG